MNMPIVGSSAGSEDLSPALMEELRELLVRGITVMPGKPALMAAVGGRPVVGIPGYPVSAEEKKWLRYTCQEIYRYSTVFKIG